MEKNVGRRQALLASVHYWHLLSLDAPTVAALWAWSFARAFHLAFSPAGLLLLFAGTWLLYIADRILDGFHQDSARLRERHLFYLRHRTVAIATAIPICVFLVWLVLYRTLPGVRLDDALISSVAASYFLLVHLCGRAIERWFPKELIVALVFASATAVPAWARLTDSRASLVMIAALFAALCWLNCIAIEKWEQVPHAAATPICGPLITDHTTRWGQRHLRRVSAVIATVASLASVLLLHSNPSAAGLCFAAALAAAVFLPLDRRPLSAFHLRIAADAALLTPLLIFLIR
jgi:hypothetical protein